MSARRHRSGRRPELSQHFLRSRALAASLVSQAPVRAGDLIVEIGPGRGILTAELARAGRRVVGVELDPELCGGLRERFAGDRRVSIVHGDFLAHRLPQEAGYKVVGNVPFASTAAILEKLVRAASPPDDAFLIVQQEAAERFAGTPFASESMMSMHLKPWWQVEIVRRLRRCDFEPPPRVDAVALWLARRPRPLIDEEVAVAYRDLIRTCFGRSGNTVGRCLRSVLTTRQVRRLARDLRFDVSRPPSLLAFEQWLGIFRFWMLETAGKG